MLIMGYPRSISSDSWGILIPPFRTGHLGFIPDSEVYASLMYDDDDDGDDRTDAIGFCELLVTPFARQGSNLVRLECAMTDRTGVVKSLIDAVSTLRANIVTLESTVNKTQHGHQHQVTMIIDLATAPRSVNKPGPRAVDFSEYARNVPLDDAPLVRVFESIAEHCAPILAWEEEGEEVRPRIRIRRVHHAPRGTPKNEKINVRRGDSPSYNIRLDLPGGWRKSICSRLKCKTVESLSYFLFSETEERALHVYFYRNDQQARLFHLGFYHHDEPGTLSSVLRLVAGADFDIITSLLRKECEKESVWEALLEYRGKSELPSIEATQEDRLRWAGKRLCEQIDSVELGSTAAQIGHPRYPMAKDEALRTLRLPLQPDRLGSVGTQHRAPRPPIVLEDSHDKYREARGCLAAVVNRRKSPQVPVVFVSYPAAARRHAVRLMDELRNDGYEPVDGMAEQGQVILPEVVEKIIAANYFIGIWHHEEREAGGVSPWLPFELGVAMAHNKKSLMVRSEKLPDHIWKRIDPGQQRPAYSDLEFRAETIPVIIEYARKNFPRR